MLIGHNEIGVQQVVTTSAAALGLDLTAEASSVAPDYSAAL